MPRLLLIIGLVFLVGAVVRRLLDSGIFGPSNTYRPRQRPFGDAFGRNKDQQGDSATFLVSRAELTGLRDSFTAETIDPDRALMRCPSCQAYYHADSIKVLERENDGKCVTCSGTSFDPVQVTH